MKGAGGRMCGVIRKPLAGLVVFVLFIGCSPGGPGKPITNVELIDRLVDLERRTAAARADETGRLVRQFGETMVHTRVLVDAATVIAVYRRETDWKTNPYFAVDYRPETYAYLGDLDPQFHRELLECRTWLSVARTEKGRQMMYELAVEPAVHVTLAPGQVVDFTCELATVIRGGKSVYGRVIRLETIERPGPGH